MRKITFILIFLWSTCQAQMQAHWVTNKELGVQYYEVQQSIDTLSWVALSKVAPLKKDSNTYVYSLPATNYFYRVAAIMDKNKFYYTKAILLPKALAVTITNLAVQGSYLTWQTQNENKNVSYYAIEETYGTVWRVYKKVTPKGDGNYKIRIK